MLFVFLSLHTAEEFNAIITAIFFTLSEKSSTEFTAGIVDMPL